ncbi:hypothetical protein NE235_10625 [Actinoallomurus spadix]|uniref:Uncharacterized protein n=1 Tax=Actinoallomurus spadix TaxID=79912 RepID=A0ABN0WVD8_9ACTN|nr:hypothetical protein [Actinoallomurus spadix]MCO5986556.1 hypothetical protein [Actinoallomurus spadix]
MTPGDVAWALVGWQAAIFFRLIADLIINQRDRRRARRRRAAAEAR